MTDRKLNAIRSAGGRAREAFFGILVIAALIALVIRGPIRGLSDSGDFATVYAASRAWMTHADPYRQTDLDRLYLLAHGDAAHAPNSTFTASVYPPGAFPLVASIAWLDWERVRLVWVIVNAAAFAASLFCIASSRLIPSRQFAAATIAAFLLFSPVQTGIAKGQPSVICISLIVCALYIGRSAKEEIVSGLLLGVSCCIKPNIALPYILFCCWRRQWRVAGVAAAVALAVSAAACIELQTFAPGWRQEWLENVRSSVAAGGSMDPTITGPISHLLVNFQTVIGFFTANQRLCDAVTYVLVGGAAAVVVVIVRSPKDQWPLLALLSLFTLLSSYHRYYDVQLLMPGVNAILPYFRKGFRPYLMATLFAPLMLLWLPLQAMASKILSPGGDVPSSLLKTVAHFLVFRNQPICLSVLAVFFIVAIIRRAAAAKTAPLAPAWQTAETV